jgi:hypothetical protein
MHKALISVGYKKGGMDFEIACAVQGLSHAEMNDLRSMIVVAIGTMEDMWRREQERKAPTAQAELEKR